MKQHREEIRAIWIGTHETNELSASTRIPYPLQVSSMLYHSQISAGFREFAAIEIKWNARPQRRHVPIGVFVEFHLQIGLQGLNEDGFAAVQLTHFSCALGAGLPWMKSEFMMGKVFSAIGFSKPQQW